MRELRGTKGMDYRARKRQIKDDLWEDASRPFVKPTRATSHIAGDDNADERGDLYENGNHEATKRKGCGRLPSYRPA